MTLETVNYAEFFAGVGGFRDGIEQSGLDAECVYANEFDRHASAVYRHIWRANGELIEGDIREQKTDEIPDVNFLTAGFPCQSFSVAGKRLGLADTRGTLFFEVARFLADKRPRHFLLENVKGLLSHDDGKTIQTMFGVLADLGYRIEWEVLNSTCWVPQNRERIFIVGHLRGECRCQVFPLREDDGVYPEAAGQDVGVRIVGNTNPSGRGMSGNVYSPSGVAPTLCSESTPSHEGSMSGRPPIIVAETAYTKSNRKGSRVRISDTISNLDSGNSCAVGVPVLQMGHRAKGKVRVYNNEIPAMTQDYGTGGQNVLDKALFHRYRRLTPVECERLQGWRDNHTAIGLYLASTLPKSRRNGHEYQLQPISNTQRYRMTGNGVTADVVREVILKMMRVGCFG